MITTWVGYLTGIAGGWLFRWRHGRGEWGATVQLFSPLKLYRESSEPTTASSPMPPSIVGAMLTMVKGVGDPSVHMLMIFSLHRPPPTARCLSRSAQ
ncbi:hypothetical protein COCNU_11G001550 [Cocos nucifera]|uniref:Uncharacterized protein n=1 Tax=Cocos nucifera TaxID=13894 RepID=A0A8K0INQ5_COCNU|nr:hypothetical protein COCNU_11G001550 [Cocos nucifera]